MAAADGEETPEEREKSQKRVADVCGLWQLLSDSGAHTSALSSDVIECVFKTLDKDDILPQSSQCDDQQTNNSELFDLAVKCFIKVVQLVQQASKPQECQLDTPSLIMKFLACLGTCTSHHSITRVSSLLGVIPQLLADEPILQAIFVGVGCFESMTAVLASLPEEEEDQNRLCKSCIYALSSITSGSHAAKEVFKASVGYDKICNYLKKLRRPTNACVITLLDWAVEGDYLGGDLVITNVDVILLLLQWLETVDVSVQCFASEHIRRLCQTSTHNAMLCSVSGVFTKILQLLDKWHRTISDKWAESLIGILEDLGYHSVSASELKQLISLFRPFDDDTQVKFTRRLLKALVKMSCGGGKNRAKYYFDLHETSARIRVPSITKWPGSGFTFHAWVCLEPDSARQRKPNAPPLSVDRRLLYSFFSASGTGVEAFLTHDGTLVVASSNKREYHSVMVPDCNLTDRQWHALGISYTSSRRPFGQSSVAVYLDGVSKIVSPLKISSFSEELCNCLIGSGHPVADSHPPSPHPVSSKPGLRFPFTRTGSLDVQGGGDHCSSIGAWTQDIVWGAPRSLQGQLGSVSVFSEGLAESFISALYNAGPNDLGIFQPTDVSGSSQCSLPELSTKLVLYYSAKAGQDVMCSDLTPPLPGRASLPGRLTGYRCVRWNMKDVIQAIGGVEIFLPLFDELRFQSGDEMNSKAFNLAGSISSETPSSCDIQIVIQEPDTITTASSGSSPTAQNECVSDCADSASGITNNNGQTTNRVIGTLQRDNGIRNNHTSSGTSHSEAVLDTKTNLATTNSEKQLQSCLEEKRNNVDECKPEKESDVVEQPNDFNEDWTIVNRQFGDASDFQAVICRLCELPDCSDISLLMYLIISIFKDDDVTESVYARRLPYLAHLLESRDPRLIDVHVLKALQAMVECLMNESLLRQIYHHLVFNFRIWTLCAFDARIGHIQYLSTIVKDNPRYFRESYGVRFFLDIIRMYYVGPGESLCTAADLKRAGALELSEVEVRMIRASLLGLVKFYLQQNPSKEEATYLVDYLHSVQDPELVNELLDQIIALLTKTPKMVKRLSEPGHVCVFVSLLLNHKAEHVRLKIFKVMATIVTSHQVPDANKGPWRLQDSGIDVLTRALHGEASERIITGLLELGVSNVLKSKGIHVYGYYQVVLTVVDMVKSMELPAKLLISQMILRSLDTSRESHTALASEPGWYDSLLRLLVLRSRDEIQANQSAASPSCDEEPTNQEASSLSSDLIDTVLEIVFRVLWRGIQGHDEKAWKERGQAMASISTIASTHVFLIPSRALERTLLELCLQGEVVDIRSSGQTGASETENALMIMRLVEDFLFTPESFTGEKIDEEHSWSVKLVEQVADLLEALNVWSADDSEEHVEWQEMAQIGVRILLGSIAHVQTELCATASSKLSALLKARTMTSQLEVCFVLGSLYKAFLASKEKEGCRNFTFIIPVIRIVLLKYREQLPLTIYVPEFSAPDRMHPKFDEEFLELAETDEFKALMRQQILPGIKQFEAKFENSSVLSGRFWMQCLTALQSSLKQRDQLSADGRERFARQVTKAAQELRTKLQERDKGLLRARSQQSARNAIDWLLTKRRLTSERAPWAYRTPEEVHWKLSTEETFQRMRLRMTQNLNYSYHMEASNARDNKSDENLDGDTLSQSVPLRVAREAVVMRSLEADEDEELTASNNSVSPPMSPPKNRASVVEKVVLEVDCELVTLMDVMPGKLKVSTTHVYFTANRSSDAWDLTTVYEFTWALAELREVHLRRHNLRRSALEFFLVDQTNYFINCSKKARNTVYKKIMSLRPPNLYYMGARSPAQLLKASGLTERWVKREISNFEYLMQLNTIAGRTYNDLSQYPVFPWVLVDYESKDLDLSNRAVYRDLSKPIGVLNPARVKEVEDRYKHFEDPTGTIAKFHYGTHYSNSANVLFYLLRVEPFTTLHVALHSGRFDCADRQFHSIPALWDSLFNKASDVKELVPEFFYFPEFLENLNGFDLGRLQGGARVNHVTLPPWARTPEEFVHKHRQALESEYVSTHLHDWIDLIFGYKQRGEKAVEAHNVFYYCTYEGAVDLDAITNEAERIATEGMINNFGQTPSQLLTTPHPVRMTQADAAAHKQKALEIAGTSKPLANVFEHVDKLKAYFVVVTDSCDPLVFAAVPRVQARLLIHHGMPDCMVTVTRSGILGNQDWLPYSKTKSRPFTFELDPALSSVKLRRTVAGPFSPDVTVTSRHFAMTQDARLIITAGHWDNTIRVFSIKGKLQSRITAHSDTVTCLSIDRDGHHLMTGSRDTTCRLWLVSHVGGWAADVDKSPLQTLYGHDHEVTCVVLSWELDMAVSGSRDGTCIVHTARKGQYLRTLRPMGNEPSSAPCRVTSLGLSEFGGIIVSSNTRDARALTHYSINGRLLAQERALKDDVIDIEICGDFVVTGGNSGRLGIRSLHSFKQLRSMNLLVPITSVSLAKDNTHIFVTLCDGKLIVIAVDVPAT